MKTVAIIQARMKSQRLPGKVLLYLVDKPVLWHIIDRVRHATFIDEVVVATTIQPEDDPIEHVVRSIQILDTQWANMQHHAPVRLYRGNAEDVMDRMYNATQAIKMCGGGLVVEITADCPIIDPRHIDHLVSCWKTCTHNAVGYDAIKLVATNIYPRTWPDGLDILVYSKESLDEINKIVTNPILRHHVGWNMLPWHNKGESIPSNSIVNYEAPPKYRFPNLGIVLDEYEDYQVIEHVYHNFYSTDAFFSAEKVITHLIEHPEYVFNKNVKRKTPEEG